MIDCPYCGMIHPKIICPRIKRIEYQDAANGGGYKVVEFFPPTMLAVTSGSSADPIFSIAKVVLPRHKGPYAKRIKARRASGRTQKRRPE